IMSETITGAVDPGQCSGTGGDRTGPCGGLIAAVRPPWSGVQLGIAARGRTGASVRSGTAVHRSEFHDLGLTEQFRPLDREDRSAGLLYCRIARWWVRG